MSRQKHEQARYYLHIGHDQLDRDEQSALETHLAECAACRAYAADLATLQGQLARVMHARWSRYSPSPDLRDGVETRLQRRTWQRQVLSLAHAVPTVALIVLVTVLGGVLVRQTQRAPAIPASPPATAVLQSLPPAADDEGWPVLPGLAVFEDEIRLLGFALPASSLSPGGPAEIDLYWQTQSDNPTFMVYVHLLDADGRPAEQADAPLAANTCSAIGKYSVGVTATCLSIPLPEQLAPGPYQLVVGVFDEANGQRLTTETGQTELVLTSIQVGALATETPSLSPTPTPFPIPANCPVTLPNGSTPPGEEPIPDHHGNGALWTTLWPEGRVLIPPQMVQPDGSLAMKWGWWRGVEGQLTVEGRRLDVLLAPPLRAEIAEGYGDTGFQGGGLIFPSEGCWEVTGKAGDAELTFVVLVVKVDELP
jgi:hypothetical protein